MFNKKLITNGCFLLIFLMIITFVSGAVPVQLNINTDTGINVFYPKFDYVQKDASFTLYLHTSNITNGLPISNTNLDCFLYLYDVDGSHTLESKVLEKDSNGWEHKITLSSGNFSNVGIHGFYIWCNATEIGGSAHGIFTVTEGGIEITGGRSILVMSLLGLLTFFLLLSLLCMFKIEHYIGKFALYWVSHVLIIIITFIGWQMGVEGLLNGMALTGVFRIMFWIFTIAVIPMVLLSLAWIFYIHAFNEHFQKIIDKGENPEEAFKIAKRKQGGWFNGQ